ncbi:Bug family tripartite tricarboxylate transporter substrate binding protein [Paracidovorax wautersii]|uniref:Tripartite-type tricarboxylate transporter, receptor component TctC n=1 Tax=Paracidovorax wautersii TaxID=1177982 RepID=A0A1I2GWG7_9BURK|nr:tripartite tricarboxylate transporter substrate binding protein [Paracidovorax wautersii]SFF21782.1 Tripartite-type tricarboxylate transporter, receptor component TctC [Paracidovorax wautersii]
MSGPSPQHGGGGGLGRRAWIAASAMACLVPPSRAQTARHLTFLVPQPAGNPGDVFARKLQAPMQRALGQAIVVENLPGAGGSIGLQRMLNAPADGATVAVVSQTEPILTPLSLASARYRPEQMRMIGLLGRTSYVLAGRPDMPAKTHAQLLDLARQAGAAGRPLTFGHIGQGSMIHLMGAQWARLCGVPLVHVPYRGVPPLAQDLMGSQIDLSFVPLGGSVLGMLEAGHLRAFGSTAAQTPALLPQAAPLGQQSAALKGFEHTAWGALLLPRKTPEAAVLRLHQAFGAAMRDAEVQSFLRANGTEPQEPLPLDALDRFYAAEIQIHQALARTVGVLPE